MSSRHLHHGRHRSITASGNCEANCEVRRKKDEPAASERQVSTMIQAFTGQDLMPWNTRKSLLYGVLGFSDREKFGPPVVRKGRLLALRDVSDVSTEGFMSDIIRRSRIVM